MPFPIQWQDKYSVGVDAIDQQHRELFAIANRLAVAVDSQAGPESAANTMHEMCEYLDRHFRDEEQYLAKHPDFDEHNLIHLEFIEKTLDFQIRFSDHDPDLNREILAFLMRWLTEHIMKTDKRYFSYLREHGLLAQ